MNGARVLRPLRGKVEPNDLRVGEVTDADAALAKRDADAVAAWGRMKFYRCDAMAVLVREGDDGVHGWQFGKVAHLYMEWSKIAALAIRLKASGDGDYWTRDGAA